MKGGVYKGRNWGGGVRGLENDTQSRLVHNVLTHIAGVGGNSPASPRRLQEAAEPAPCDPRAS